MKHLIITALAVLSCLASFGQVTQPNNTPVVGNYVGFDINSMDPLPIENRGFPEIDISSSGRTKFAITEQPNWLGLGGLDLDSVQRTTMGLQGEQDTAWSILHLWSGRLTSAMQRSWMNVGTTMMIGHKRLQAPVGGHKLTPTVLLILLHPLRYIPQLRFWPGNPGQNYHLRSAR